MAGKIVADTLEHSTAGSLDTQYVVNGSAKAWAHANASAVVQDSFNVSSGTDHATGDFSYALTNAYANTNHVMAASSSATGAGRICTSNTGRKTASVIAIEIESHSGSADDKPQEFIGNGDLA